LRAQKELRDKADIYFSFDEIKEGRKVVRIKFYIYKNEEVLRSKQQRLNPSLKIGGVFVTQYDSRKVLNKNVAQTIEQHFPNILFETKIVVNQMLEEAIKKYEKDNGEIAEIPK